MELAMLASRCTAPSIIHNTYAIENNIVQMALNMKNIKLHTQVALARQLDNGLWINLQVMVAGARPGVVLVSAVYQEGGEYRFCQCASGHEREEKRMVMSLDVRHIGVDEGRNQRWWLPERLKYSYM